MRKRKRPARQVTKNTIKEGKVTSFTPVRGDTVSFWTNEGGFRYALVVVAQDKEATLLTLDNDRITLPYSDLKEVFDNRMELLRSLSDEEAAQHREDYLEKWVVRCQERADQAAIARGADVDEYGNVIRSKTGRKPSDEKVQRVNAFRDKFIALVEESEYPVTKADIGDLIPDSVYTEVINAALESGKVVKDGQKRGTNYRIPGRGYSAKPEKPAPEIDAAVLTTIVEFIHGNGPTSKADLVKEFGLSTTEWATLRTALQDDGRVKVEGERRGTRYVGV
jgi:hypothetical protein